MTIRKDERSQSNYLNLYLKKLGNKVQIIRVKVNLEVRDTLKKTRIKTREKTSERKNQLFENISKIKSVNTEYMKTKVDHKGGTNIN